MGADEIKKEKNKLTIDETIDLVRTFRNDRLKKLFQEDVLRACCNEILRKDVSEVRLQFIKRELRSLLIAPVDLVYYAALIKKLNSTDEPHNLIDDDLFQNEVNEIIKKYDH